MPAPALHPRWHPWCSAANVKNYSLFSFADAHLTAAQAFKAALEGRGVTGVSVDEANCRVRIDRLGTQGGAVIEAIKAVLRAARFKDVFKSAQATAAGA